MSHRTLPEMLGPHFSTGTALANGVTKARLRGRDLERPFHGVRSRRTDEPRGAAQDARAERERVVLARAEALAQRLTPGEFFSHVTAAVIWGIPLPSGLLDPDDLDVAVFSPHRNPSGRGVRGHEVAARLASLRVHPETGLVVASPASTWAMLGAVLRNVHDLVAAGDAVVREPMHPDHPPALTGTADLHRAMCAGRRVGIRALREAYPLIRTRSASRKESQTRMVLRDAGLPEPLLNHPVCDARGDFIGRVDLAYPARKVAIEYEGRQHLLDPEQWALDIRRYERLHAAGWLVIRVVAEDLENPHVLVARVRAALARR